MAIAFVTSIGESTTDLCKWSLERQGFQVFVLSDPSSLWDKIRRIINSHVKGDILRVDADVIVNKNVVELFKQTKLWWYQALTYDWFKQDVAHGGIQFIREPAIPVIKKHIDEAQRLNRPESYLYRLKEFHEPRVCGTFEKICGLNGYRQTDKDRVKLTKAQRGQLDNYDFELAEKIETL